MDLSFYRKFAYELKREYPYLWLIFDYGSGVLGRFLEPKNLFITKRHAHISAIFTYRDFESLGLIEADSVSNKKHELLLQSCYEHDWEEINESLLPYFDELHFSRLILKSVDDGRFVRDDDGEIINCPDNENFGDDLVSVVNKRLFEILIFQIERKKFTFTDDDDIRTYGEDLFAAINQIGPYASFNLGASIDSDSFLQTIAETFGEDLVELICERAKSMDYLIREHFQLWVRDAFMGGDTRALRFLGP